MKEEEPNRRHKGVHACIRAKRDRTKDRKRATTSRRPGESPLVLACRETDFRETQRDKE